MKPLTRAGLNAIRCNIPGCDHKNHGEQKQLWMYCGTCGCMAVSYDPSRGVITVSCGSCHADVNEVLVAAGAEA